ncbi:hypothetical protein BDW74DRAFT_181173 [Aspergillus multicolor]|uniref:uncharacterized protein n=1 Tax=Aspergillus multicolor TaxID=41759 RepID=UPI003CCE17A6
MSSYTIPQPNPYRHYNPSLKSALKPKWYRDFLFNLRHSRKAQEDQTLYIGFPQDAKTPFIIILRGHKTKTCQWWYLGDPIEYNVPVKNDSSSKSENKRFTLTHKIHHGPAKGKGCSCCCPCKKLETLCVGDLDEDYETFMGIVARLDPTVDSGYFVSDVLEFSRAEGILCPDEVQQVLEELFPMLVKRPAALRTLRCVLMTNIYQLPSQLAPLRVGDVAAAGYEAFVGILTSLNPTFHSQTLVEDVLQYCCRRKILAGHEVARAPVELFGLLTRESGTNESLFEDPSIHEWIVGYRYE